jgi:hypothetical protein
MAANGLQQHNKESGLCLAMRHGMPCSDAVHKEKDGGSCGYCKYHMEHGDHEAVYEYAHEEIPELSKVLAATRDLPKGYKFSYWGTLRNFDPKHPSAEWAMEFGLHRGVVDPTPHPGSKMQYASAPGPDESRNLKHVFEGSRGECNTFNKNRSRQFPCTCKVGRLVGREMELAEPVAKDEMILFKYRDGWFTSRDIPKVNVGTKKHPAPLAPRLRRAEPEAKRQRPADKVRLPALSW